MMNGANTFVDPLTAQLLQLLHNNKGMQYKDLKKESKLSHSALAVRLKMLKHYNMLQLDARLNGDGRSFVVYRLNEMGEKFWKQLEALMQSIPQN